MNIKKSLILALAVVALLGGSIIAWSRSTTGATKAVASESPSTGVTAGMTYGSPDLKSANVLAFGPESVLFIGDSQSGAVFAVDVKDAAKDASATPVEVKEIDRKIASMLGTTPDQIVINDMATHATSQNIYLAISRGRGADGVPVLLRVTKRGAIEEVSLSNVLFSKVALTNLPGPTDKTRWGANKRAMSITDMAFADGQVFVSGLSNEEFASSMRRIPFPFGSEVAATNLEVFHTAHNRFETEAPVETFMPYRVKGQPALLASYTCTPMAAFPLSDLREKKLVRGTTIAELGGGNRPLDMIAYQKNGKDYILISNSDRTLMSINAEDIERAQPLTTGVGAAYLTAGVKYVAVAEVGILQLDNLNSDHAVVIQRSIEDGSLNLRSLQKKWL
ncbi:MAG TPA: hypothetical protein VID27_06225 [Blastocatellia bacterium]